MGIVTGAHGMSPEDDALCIGLADAGPAPMTRMVRNNGAVVIWEGAAGEWYAMAEPPGDFNFIVAAGPLRSWREVYEVLCWPFIIRVTAR